MSTLSWGDVEELVARLIAALRQRNLGSFDRVLGVARGGWIPAALVAQALDVRCLESVQVTLYDGMARRVDGPAVAAGAPLPQGPSGVPGATLIVDEMIDSGATLRALRSMYPSACFAVLVAREAPAGWAEAGPAGEAGHGPPERVIVGRVLRTHDWVLFPWSPAEDRLRASEGS